MKLGLRFFVLLVLSAIVALVFVLGTAVSALAALGAAMGGAAFGLAIARSGSATRLADRIRALGLGAVVALCAFVLVSSRFLGAVPAPIGAILSFTTSCLVVVFASSGDGRLGR